MTLRELLRRLGALLDRYVIHLIVAALVSTFVFAVVMDRIVVTIPAGHAGVLWKRFAGGTVVDRIFGEGLRLIWPWDEMTLYDLRFQAVEGEFDAVDRDGLRLRLQVSTRLRLAPDRLGELHKQVGPNYLQVIVNPQVGSQARTVIASRSAEAVYATERAAVETEIRRRLRDEVTIKGAGRLPDFDFIRIEDILIRNIVLPPLVASAVEQKIQQFHVMKEWEFRLQRERLESQRKEIEGEGIRQFQARVTPGISEQYLRWKGIDATLKLAESANAKIVIIGSGPQGLPVILGNDVLQSPGAPARPGPRADAPAETPPPRPLTDDTHPAPPPAAAATAPAATKPAAASAKAPESAAPPQTGGITGFINRMLGLGR